MKTVPPTLSESPALRETWTWFRLDVDGGDVICSSRVTGDEREITSAVADVAVQKVISLATALAMEQETCPSCGDGISGQGGWCWHCDG